ncbi:hypothetical protein MRB53_027148 [Persea americana]|uniref:Uncharacterized protein n=1 Tax=Persea americana TaxID=3435 RepID=A0ACC2LL45_PERAE|nr:hypothetical protein MRB53_027148 [Persea americana]
MTIRCLHPVQRGSRFFHPKKRVKTSGGPDHTQQPLFNRKAPQYTEDCPLCSFRRRLFPVSVKALLHCLSGLYRPFDRRGKVFLLHPFQHRGVPQGRPAGPLAVPREPLDAPTVAEAISVISGFYEARTEWGQRVGWIYGSVTEDVVTGYIMHYRGWRSIYCVTKRDAFRGTAPINLIDRLHQVLRWATGSEEILFSRNNALFSSPRMKLLQRVCHAPDRDRADTVPRLLANNRMERVERLCLPTQRHGSRATASDQARVSSVLNYCHLLSAKGQQNRQIVSIRNPKPFLKALPLWNVDSIIDLDMQASPRLVGVGVMVMAFRKVSRKTGGTANPQGSSLLVSDPAWPQAIPVICISNNVALVSPKEGPKPRQLLSLPPFPATPCLLHVKKTAAYEWLPSARSLTTSLTSPAPSSSSRATSTKDS